MFHISLFFNIREYSPLRRHWRKFNLQDGLILEGPRTGDWSGLVDSWWTAKPNTRTHTERGLDSIRVQWLPRDKSNRGQRDARKSDEQRNRSVAFRSILFFFSSSFSPPRRIDSRSLLDSRMHRGRRRGGSPPPDRSRFRHGPAQNDRLFPLARFLLSFRHWTLDRAARTESGKFTAERAMNVLSIIHFLFLRSCNLFLFSLSNFQRTKFLKITFRRMNRSPSI